MFEYFRKKKEDLNKKFFFSTKIIYDDLDDVFWKAINRKGEFVWIGRYGFPHPDITNSFYLTIITDLNRASSNAFIANSFNMFRSREDFYNQYTFVKKVKEI